MLLLFSPGRLRGESRHGVPGGMDRPARYFDLIRELRGCYNHRLRLVQYARQSRSAGSKPPTVTKPAHTAARSNLAHSVAKRSVAPRKQGVGCSLRQAPFDCAQGPREKSRGQGRRITPGVPFPFNHLRTQTRLMAGASPRGVFVIVSLGQFQLCSTSTPSLDSCLR